MIEILAYGLIVILFLTIIFFLLRSLLVAISMFTEVPYLPSDGGFKEAIRYLDIENGDNVLDIGSGDGRVLIYASKKYPNSQFVGIERNLFLVIYSNILKFLLRRDNLQFKHIDAHKFDISEFNKIYLYLLPKFIDSILLKKKKDIKKGCTVLSYHFPMGYIFPTVNKVTKYPVKYRGKEENIFKWIKE
jgi:hypothetical protein